MNSQYLVSIASLLILATALFPACYALDKLCDKEYVESLFTFLVFPTLMTFILGSMIVKVIS